MNENVLRNLLKVTGTRPFPDSKKSYTNAFQEVEIKTRSQGKLFKETALFCMEFILVSCSLVLLASALF